MKKNSGASGGLESPATDAVLGVNSRPLGLFVVRESDEWDLELFNAMREQTYLRHRDVAAVEAIRLAGLDPFAEGGTFTVRETDRFGVTRDVRVVVEPEREGSARAVLFYYGGYWHLWSRTSAAKLGASGVNDFTQLLIRVLRRIRPVNLYAANFSRLIRSQSQGSRLQAELDGTVDVVWAGEMAFPFAGPQAQVGMMMFSMFSMIASMERDWIVQRLLAGRIAKWRRKEWPHGTNHVPFGHTIDPVTKELVVDVSARAAVREMMLVLGNPETPPAEMIRQLQRAGMTGMRRHRRLENFVPVTALKNATWFINTLYAWAALWCDGEYLFRVTNVFPHMQELAGVPVVRDPEVPDDVGEMQMLYKVGLPEGGWAEPEVVAQFRNAAVARMRGLVAKGATDVRPLAPSVVNESANPELHTQLLNADRAKGQDAAVRGRRDRARAKRTIAPFTGRGWFEDDWYYELQVMTQGRYRLMRWPMLGGARGKGASGAGRVRGGESAAVSR